MNFTAPHNEIFYSKPRTFCGIFRDFWQYMFPDAIKNLKNSPTIETVKTDCESELQTTTSF